MNNHTEYDCASCNLQDCRNGNDCFGLADDHLALYKEEGIHQLHKAASAIEARHYCKETRLGEIIQFGKEMRYTKIGLAFCVGLASEAKAVAEILTQHFEVVSVCCKVGGIDKTALNLEQIHDGQFEVMCNPMGQAELLNRAETQWNILCGLCVGHDALFSMHSNAPVTTLIAKDRVLAHNPAAAVYCQYIRKKLPLGN